MQLGRVCLITKRDLISRLGLLSRLRIPNRLTWHNTAQLATCDFSDKVARRLAVLTSECHTLDLDCLACMPSLGYDTSACTRAFELAMLAAGSSESRTACLLEHHVQLRLAKAMSDDMHCKGGGNAKSEYNMSRNKSVSEVRIVPMFVYPKSNVKA